MRHIGAAVVVLLLAACGRVFDHPPVDATPAIPLACNTPVMIGGPFVAHEKVSATLDANRFAVAWVTDDGKIQGEQGTIDNTLALAVAGTFVEATSTWTDVSLASDGMSILVAASDINNATGDLWTLSDSDGSQLAHLASTTVLSDRLGATVIPQPANYSYAIAGTSTTTSETAVTEVRGSTAPQQRSIGASQPELGIVALDARIAVLVDDAIGDCTVVTVDVPLTSTSASTATGDGGKCVHPSGAHLPGRSDMLFAYHQSSSNVLLGIIGTLQADGTFNNTGEVMIASIGDRPAAVAVSDGYWLSFEQSGQLLGAHVGFVLSANPPTIVLGPIGDATAHAIVTFGGNAYVTWLNAGNAFIARLC